MESNRYDILDTDRIDLSGIFYHVSIKVDLGDNLNNDRPLWLCTNPNEWWPSHIENKRYKVYEFKLNGIKQEECFYTKSWKEYQSMCNVVWVGEEIEGDVETTLWEYTEKGLDKINNGIKVFILLSDNDKGELSEIFVVNPKDNVTVLDNKNNI